MYPDIGIIFSWMIIHKLGYIYIYNEYTILVPFDNQNVRNMTITGNHNNWVFRNKPL